MNPKRAQEQTERKWECLSNEETIDDAPRCGWCVFALGIRGLDRVCLRRFCPVVRVFHTMCFDIPAYCDWDRSFGTDMEAAQRVHDLVVANRDALIQAGEEILREQTIRD